MEKLLILKSHDFARVRFTGVKGWSWEQIIQKEEEVDITQLDYEILEKWNINKKSKYIEVII